jgi:hypothetical protein
MTDTRMRIIFGLVAVMAISFLECAHWAGQVEVSDLTG